MRWPLCAKVRLLRAGMCRHLCRCLAVVDAEDDRDSTRVGVRLLHARAVGETVGDLSSRRGAGVHVEPAGRGSVRVLRPPVGAWQQGVITAAVGGPDRLWPVAQAVAAAVPGTMLVARDDSAGTGILHRTTSVDRTLW
jgi:hypothetical protein